MLGTVTDKAKVLLLIVVLSALALSAYPRGVAYVTRASMSDKFFKPDYRACDALNEKLVQCDGPECENVLKGKVKACRRIVENARDSEISVCDAYAQRVEECSRRNVNCKAHISNLIACKAAVDASFSKSFSALQA